VRAIVGAVHRLAGPVGTDLIDLGPPVEPTPYPLPTIPGVEGEKGEPPAPKGEAPEAPKKDEKPDR
jgi:hypothetical protein